MPYDSIEELPESVKGALPEHAQEIFMKAFNDAWDRYEDPSERRGGDSREEVAMKVSWAAVKKNYRKNKDGDWVKK
ncbi:MAG: ChaB family protein [Thermoplasmatota archaeon]